MATCNVPGMRLSCVLLLSRHLQAKKHQAGQHPSPGASGFPLGLSDHAAPPKRRWIVNAGCCGSTSIWVTTKSFIAQARPCDCDTQACTCHAAV